MRIPKRAVTTALTACTALVCFTLGVAPLSAEGNSCGLCGTTALANLTYPTDYVGGSTLLEDCVPDAKEYRGWTQIGNLYEKQVTPAPEPKYGHHAVYVNPDCLTSFIDRDFLGLGNFPVGTMIIEEVINISSSAPALVQALANATPAEFTPKGGGKSFIFTPVHATEVVDHVSLQIKISNTAPQGSPETYLGGTWHYFQKHFYGQNGAKISSPTWSYPPFHGNLHDLPPAQQEIYPANADALSCWGCHLKNAGTDQVFTQYLTLRE